MISFSFLIFFSLQVINETIERGNSSRILKQLNDMYGGRLKGGGGMGNISGEVIQPSTVSVGGGRAPMKLAPQKQQQQQLHQRNNVIAPNNKNSTVTPYDSSLTAFIFMSFGVFLLNQIHSFVQKSSAASMSNSNGNKLDDGGPGHGAALGRALLGHDIFDWFVEPLKNLEDGVTTGKNNPANSLLFSREPSSLDILFQEPKPEPRLLPGTPSNSNGNGSDPGGEWSGRSVNGKNVDSFSSSQHVNNMFRAFLNIANAYTRNSEAMECIWSLYCKDLDVTAGKRGLYGVAARINRYGSLPSPLPDFLPPTKII